MLKCLYVAVKMSVISQSLHLIETNSEATVLTLWLSLHCKKGIGAGESEIERNISNILI